MRTLAEAALRYMAEEEIDYIENGIVYVTTQVSPDDESEEEVDAEEAEETEDDLFDEAKEEDDPLSDALDDAEEAESDEDEAESTDDAEGKYAVFVSTSKKYDISNPDDIQFIEEVEIPNRDEIANMKLDELQEGDYSSIEIDGTTYDQVKSASIYEDEDGVLHWEE